MALTEIYVDPAEDADSGTGTLLDPFGDLEYAIEETDWDAVNGIRVNIRAGADEVLAANLVTAMADVSSPNKSIAWTPSATAPLVFEGYTAAAGDGGIGGISGNGATTVFTSTTTDYVTFKNLHCHNTGANAILDVGDRCLVANCELNNSSSFGFRGLLVSQIINSYVHGITGANAAVYFNNTGVPISYGNFIEYEGTGEAVRLQTGASFQRNIVIVTDSGASGINLNCSTFGVCKNNSIYSTNNSDGFGIQVAGRIDIRNNLIEGFSGAGGFGINIVTNSTLVYYAGNAVYDCDTEYNGTTDFDYTPEAAPDNETLTASPFANPGGGDFSPVNTGNVREGSLPSVIGGGLN